MNFNFIILLIVVLIVSLFCFFVVNPIATHIVKKTPNKFDDLLVEKNVISRFFLLVPALIFGAGLPHVLKNSEQLLDIFTRVYNVWIALGVFAICCALLDSIESLNNLTRRTRAKPFHGIFQAIKLGLFCIAAIVVVSQVSGRSPVLILSALGAAATVLMLVFRDSILGVVSGVQINLSDLLRKGDWIEIERHHADGNVIDITLTSVKIRNWDNTVSVIPAYDLITNSFRNWRGMEESGCRRIKRALSIDLQSVKFLSQEEIKTLSNIKILKPYLQAKMSEIGKNLDENSEMNMVNERHLTNIGTFRAYCTAYLRSLGTISQNATLMTRQLPPTSEGIPLEIYAFANVTEWVKYEAIQADIFDHLIAVLPLFGLRLFEYYGAKGK